MTTDYIDIPNGKWGVVVIYDFDTIDERVDLLAIMRSFGMSLYNSNRALEILSNYNTGMAISLADLKMSAVFIGQSTSPSEFYSTAIHEFIHVADSIIDYYGESWGGEPSAYLVGYLTKEFVELVGEPCF